MGTSPSVLKNIKIVEIEPPMNTNVQTNIALPANTENEQAKIIQDTNIKENCPLDTNVQVEVIVPTEEPTVAQTAPSGEAIGASVEVIKDKTSEEKIGESGRVPVVGPSLLSIDNSQVEKKNITEMSPIELMVVASQKMMEESTDKGIIDQSIIVLHRLVPECKIENKVSPPGKLKVIIEHISKNFQSLQQISN